ncbi:MAG: hypothetical protein ACKO0Z_10085, partial [Betaproteobacteria bacterium]
AKPELVKEAFSRQTLDSGKFKPLGILGRPNVTQERAPQMIAEGHYKTNYLRTANVENYQDTDAQIRISFENYEVANVTDSEIVLGTRKDYEEGIKGVDTYIEITDNPAILRLPDVDRIAVAQKMRMCLEEYAPNDRDILAELSKNNAIGTGTGTSEISPQHLLKRSSIGNPLVLEAPAESVINIHVPGSPKNIVGHIFLLDQHGNFISRHTSADLATALSPGAVNQSLAANISMRASRILRGNDQGLPFDPMSEQFIRTCQTIFGELIDKDIAARFKNGINGQPVAFDNNEHAYAIMFSRALMREHTRLLYIPKDYVVYLACQYDQHGIGVSKMDTSGIVNTLRSTSLLANVMGGIKNAIGVTVVSADIPKNDPNPARTDAIIRDAALRNRQFPFPTNGGDVDEIARFCASASLRFKIKSDQVPGLNIEYSTEKPDYQPVDDNTINELRKLGLGALCLPIETIDRANNDLAIKELHANMQLRKATTDDRLIIDAHLTRLHRIYARSSSKLRAELIEFATSNVASITINDDDIRKSFSDRIKNDSDVNKYKVAVAVNAYLDSFEAKLPESLGSTISDTSEMIINNIDAWDKLSTILVNDSIFTSDTAGPLSEAVPLFQALIKRKLCEEYLSRAGIQSPISEMFTVDKTDATVGTGAVVNDLSSLLTGAQQLITDLKVVGNRISKGMEEKGVSDISGGGSGGGSDDYSSYDNSSDSGDNPDEDNLDNSDDGASDKSGDNPDDDNPGNDDGSDDNFSL